jgi:hypothetical protein
MCVQWSPWYRPRAQYARCCRQACEESERITSRSWRCCTYNGHPGTAPGRSTQGVATRPVKSQKELLQDRGDVVRTMVTLVPPQRGAVRQVLPPGRRVSTHNCHFVARASKYNDRSTWAGPIDGWTAVVTTAQEWKSLSSPSTWLIFLLISGKPDNAGRLRRAPKPNNKL